MAPNLIKSSSQLSLDLSNHITFNLEQSVAALYPPLTDSTDLSAYEEGLHQTDRLFSSPAKEGRRNSALFNLMVKDEAHRAVSCDQIEANLVADANQRNQAQGEEDDEYYVSNERIEEEESYWDMPSDCDVAQEETKVLSTDQVERTLIEDALRRIEEAKKAEDEIVVNKHPNNAYWDWVSEPVLESEKKASLIASVLLEESIRDKLSIDSITLNEVFNNNKDANGPYEVSQIASSDSISAEYWYWNADENAESKEDVIVAPHVHDPTHPNHSYWNFPNEPITAQDLKQKLIDKILNEERIRELLSSDVTEEREVNFHRQSNTSSKEYQTASESELNSMPENYWDFHASYDNDLLSMLSKEKQALINRILKEEQQRYIVSMENIEKNLVSEKRPEDELQSLEGSSSISISYWDW